MLLTKQIANDIVTRSMSIIHHNVNVINNQGVIVASGDSKRVGEIHEAAVEAIRSSKRIAIYNDEEASHYAHVMPGINHPIIIDDKVELVIGVSGNPVVIQRYAELAILTAELLVQQEVQRRNVNWLYRVRDMLFVQYIDGEKEQRQHVLSKLRDSGFVFTLPTIPVIINVEAIEYNPDILGVIIAKLAELDTCDVILLSTRELLLLHPESGFDDQSFLQEVHHILNEQLNKYYIGVGVRANSEDHVRDAVHFARSVIEIGRSVTPDKQVFRFKDMALLCLFNELENSYLFNFFLGICQKLLDHDSGESLIETLETFLSFNGEMGNTATQLGIHRNTLTYRLQIIKKLTGLDPSNFTDMIQLSVSVYGYRKHCPKPQPWLEVLI